MASFSVALEAICGQTAKSGHKIARESWNVKDVYVVFQPGYPDGIPINENTAKATGLPLGSMQRFLPYLLLRTADGAFVPWMISQMDVLADDWVVQQISPA